MDNKNKTQGIRCEKCDSTLSYIRMRKQERVCRNCGHIKKLKTQGEQQAEPLSKVSAQASNKASDNNVLGDVDSTNAEKVGGAGAKNEQDNNKKGGSEPL